jgi:hypothetical protein
MRVLVRIGVLGLAAYGAVTIYQRLRPRVSAAEERAAVALEETIQPAVRAAVDDVSAASRQAVGLVVDASKEAIATAHPTAPVRTAPTTDAATSN